MAPASEHAPAAPIPGETLTVRDDRTGKVYRIPFVFPLFFIYSSTHLSAANRIVDNTVAATAFKAIKAPRKHGEREENETEKGLRVADRGFMNVRPILFRLLMNRADMMVCRRP
jgi:citrate synthase